MKFLIGTIFLLLHLDFLYEAGDGAPQRYNHFELTETTRVDFIIRAILGVMTTDKGIRECVLHTRSGYSWKRTQRALIFQYILLQHTSFPFSFGFIWTHSIEYILAECVCVMYNDCAIATFRWAFKWCVYACECAGRG